MDSELTAEQVHELASRGDVQLIDVRTPEEHVAAHIAGDLLIELGELSARRQEIDRDRPVVFYCKSGSRSAMATDAFRAAGYDAANMLGGIDDWLAAGLPAEPVSG